MILVNLIIGQKRNLLNNLKSISNCQNKKIKNLNFFVFWSEDKLNSDEILLINKRITNTKFIYVNRNSFKQKIIKILKNKNHPKKLKNNIINDYLQYSLVKYAFTYVSKLPNIKKIYKSTYWQRIRSDCYVEKRIPNFNQKKVLFLPGTIHGYGIIDYHALGTYEEFKVYTNLISTMVDLYNLNIFLPAEVVLRFHLTKYNVNSVLTEKIPAALLYNSSNLKLKTTYFANRSKQHLPNYLSNNFVEKDFKFKKYYFLRRIYYFIYDIYIRFKLIIFQE